MPVDSAHPHPHAHFAPEPTSSSRGVEMSRSASPGASAFGNAGNGFKALAERLTASSFDESESRLMSVGIEMEALASIYGEEACRLHAPSRPSSWIGPPPANLPGTSGSPRNSMAMSRNGTDSVSMSREATNDSRISQDSADIPDLADLRFGERVRYELCLPLAQDTDTEWVAAIKESPSLKLSSVPLMRILVSLPSSYPAASAPQLQLLGRYLGQFSIDSALFGEVTRIFFSSSPVASVKFTPGDVCVFEGVEAVLSLTRKWYFTRLREGKEGEKAREMDRHMGRSGRALAADFDEEGEMGTQEILSPVTAANHDGPSTLDRLTREELDDSSNQQNRQSNAPFESPMLSETVPAYVKIFSSAPITVNRSVFVGHACRIKDPLEVPAVIHQLLSDKKISKATHPVIHAYRIVKETGSGQLLLSDNDDDGESAAGGRLAHLLQILELENVLVVVSRWYGGVLLGAERFKLINQAARDALELGGFLDVSDGKKKGGRG